MKRATLFLLLGVLIIATFLRLHHLTTTPPGLYPDEAMNGSNALQVIRTHEPKVYYPENNGREGLFMNLQAIFLLATGKLEPWVLRLPSAIFGILTVLGVFFLTRALFPGKDEEALLASFLLATSFWHIVFSRIGFRAIMAPFFLVWSLCFFIFALREEKYLWRTILAGVFYGLGFYSYIAFRITPLLFLLFIPYFRKSRNFWKKTILFVAVTAIVALPIGIYYLRHPADFLGRASEVSVTNSSSPLKDAAINTWKTIGMLDVRGDENWRHNVPGRPEIFWPVGILFWLGLLVGVRKIYQGGERLPYLLLNSWLALSAAPVILSNESLPHALRSILMICPIMILAAKGGAWLCQKTLKGISSASRLALISLFILILAGEAYHTYFILWAKNPNVMDAFSSNYVEIGRHARSLPAQTAKYIVVDGSSESVTQIDPFTKQLHNIPIRAQTVMFLTDSFSPERQLEQNIHYIVPGDAVTIPLGSYIFTIQ